MLMQGDVIELQLEENYVGLYGGVKLPGRYEIVYNETLDDLISLAGGFTKNADINNVEIMQYSLIGNYTYCVRTYIYI